MPPETMPMVTSEEAVLMHYKDGRPVAMTHVNGKTEIFKIGEPMTRGELIEFYETNRLREKQ